MAGGAKEILSNAATGELSQNEVRNPPVTAH